MATTTTVPKLKTHVGERIRRVEDPRLITGTATYVDDITKPGMLYAAILRSPYAAATIKSISIEKALELPGVQEAFWNEHGLQCGFCTPGMIMAVDQLLSDNPNPSRDEIRHGIEGNLCRCTGYQHIVNAVEAAAKAKGAGA